MVEMEQIPQPQTQTQMPQQTTLKQKRKREPRLKPLTETPLTKNIQSTQAEVEAVAAEKLPEKLKTIRKPRATRKKKFKPAKFHKTLALFVVRGERSASKIRDALRIDADEFERELNRLVDEGLLSRGKFDRDYLSFTVKGFDEFASLFKKTLEKKESDSAGEGVVWDARQTLLKTEYEQETQKNKGALQQALAEDKKTLGETLSASFTIAEGKEIDLEDAIKKGAPKASDLPIHTKKEVKEEKEEVEPRCGLEVDAVAKTTGELKQAVEKVAKKGAALKIGESEVCELCKAPFKLAVRGGHPKYGHCFCGAAYHQDCFETLAEGEGGGKCVRCGKKLKLTLDARAEEAVKQLKNVFEF
ncbi:MAG: hypothetical protein QW343_00230 [Candidatus Norongarragalinales archaeon]